MEVARLVIGRIGSSRVGRAHLCADGDAAGDPTAVAAARAGRQTARVGGALQRSPGMAHRALIACPDHPAFGVML